MITKRVLILILIVTIVAIFFGYKTLENGHIDTNVDTNSVTNQDISFSTSTDMVRLISPKVGGGISSPLVVKGEARGGWYFEATFPVILTDWDGLIIAEGNATAIGNWMTEEFVPFSATLEFKKPVNAGPQSERGSLILKKANASGLPERDASLEIPVIFNN